MNMSFRSACQDLILRLKQGRAQVRPRRRYWRNGLLETLETRELLSSTPAMVADINPGAATSGIENLVPIGSTTYFTANDGVHGVELWKSDGTTAGTTMVKDINPGSANSSPRNLTNVNGTLFFTVADGIYGNELWKSDGTAAGTMMVKDINPGIADSNPTGLTTMNGTLYFSAADNVHGRELWKSDGTAAGTVMVKDIFPGEYSLYGGYYPNNSNPANLTNVNGTLFFTARTSGINGQVLWKSDGTAAGTSLVSSTTFDATQLTYVNGTLFFAATNGTDGTELWKSDGTTSGTTQVKDIFPGMSKREQGPYGGYVYYPSSSRPSNLTNVNGTLFFTADDGAPGSLWKSDGTAAGTVKVASTGINWNAGLAEVNGTIYFSGYDDAHWSELWKSDGTAAGTALVKDIRSGSNGSYPNGFTNVNGTLYFTALDDVHGYELWKSNGTAAGTMMVKDIFPSGNINYGSNNYGNNNIWNLTNANGTLFFTAKDGVHGTELWAFNTAPAPSLAVSGFPTTTTAGGAGSFTVVAKNADGTTNTGYTGTIHFTSSDLQAVLPADYTFTAADHGTHTFTANLMTAGPQSITATDTQAVDNAGVQAGILVKPAVASTMTVSGFPATTTAGVAGSVTVMLKDQFGNTATGYLGTVHFSSSDPKAVLPANYAFTATDAGKHTFSVALKTAGTQSIKVADAATPALNGTEAGITVKSAAASQFLIGTLSSIKAGVAFSLTLTVEDAYGNVATSYTGTVRFTSSDNTASLPTNYTFSATDKGTHTFTGLNLRRKGNQKVTITDTRNSSLTSAVTENVN